MKIAVTTNELKLTEISNRKYENNNVTLVLRNPHVLYENDNISKHLVSSYILYYILLDARKCDTSNLIM